MTTTAADTSWFSEHYTLVFVALGSGTLGVVGGALGSYAVLRRQSLLGDAISHAALPGIILAFLIFRERAAPVLLAGALAAGWLGSLLVSLVVRTSRIKEDAALGLMLSSFFGLGLVLLTYVQKNVRDAGQAGLHRYLFGQAAAILPGDVLAMALLGSLALGTMILCWKEFKIVCFDREFAASLGYPTRLLDAVMISLQAIAIVIGLQMVGAVLMSAMIVAPAAAARQWTDRLSRMIFLAAIFGALAGIAGSILSSRAARLPAGPTIVLCATGIVVASLLFAGQRGLLWAAIRQWRSRRQFRWETVLEDLYELSCHHEGLEHGHSIAVLRAMNPTMGGIGRALEELADRGWVRRLGGNDWTLTPAGRAEAERLARRGEGA